MKVDDLVGKMVTWPSSRDPFTRTVGLLVSVRPQFGSNEPHDEALKVVYNCLFQNGEVEILSFTSSEVSRLAAGHWLGDVCLV